MTCTMDKIFTRYGSLMTRHRGPEEMQFRGFLQPFRSKSQLHTYPKFTPLGQRGAGPYVLLAPATAELEQEDTVSVADRQYTLKRIEPIMAKDTVVYYWGLCVEKEVDEPWGL